LAGFRVPGLGLLVFKAGYWAALYFGMLYIESRPGTIQAFCQK
jgi:hypothetical protein